MKDVTLEINPVLAFNGCRLVNVRMDNKDMLFTVEIKQDKVNPYNFNTINEFWSEQKKLFVLIQQNYDYYKGLKDVSFNPDNNLIEYD